MRNFNLKEIQNLIINIRNKEVLIDKDIAKLYGVETKRINAVVKNNIEKFPSNYMFNLRNNEKQELVAHNDRFNLIKHSSSQTKAFTEKGLYMLATLLRSKKANEVTFQIIEILLEFENLKTINKLSILNLRLFK